jgi:DNA-binding GntR family transcriptional regulator
MDPDGHSPKSRRIADLRRRILTLALEPDAYLGETALSGAYGISRPPLREALRQL